MKRSGKIKCAVGIAATAVLCTGIVLPGEICGSHVGAVSALASANAAESGDSGAEEEESSSAHESDVIAVVNLDIGVEEKGKTTVYADQMISLSQEEGFVAASLSGAKQGVANGTYGGYLILPESFSGTVASINSNPQTCRIRYAIDRQADADVQYKVLHKIYDFYTKLNSDLSYVYVSALLREFHTAQDGAAVVLENDSRDLQALNSISADDLIAAVEIPQLKKTESLPNPLDLTEYDQKNRIVLEEIQEDITASIAGIRTDLQAIWDSGSNLREKLGGIAENASAVEKIRSISAAEQVASASDRVQQALTEEKVQEESDSREILKTPDAANISRIGRAYLQVGNNEVYELFQSAWSGAPYRETEGKEPVDESVCLLNEL